LHIGIAALQALIHLIDGVKHSGMVSCKFPANVRQAEIGQLPHQIHGHLPGFHGALVFQRSPDYETRMAILKNKAKSLGLSLSDDVCNYIAINVTNNVRQIEGTVKKIMAYRDLNNMPLDLPNISRAIDDMFKSEGNALPTPSLIISQVCKFYSIDEVVLRGTQKNKGTAEARQVAMYLIRKLTNLSLPDIGKEFARDHSTVLYAIRKVEVALKNGDSHTQNNIRDITANINSCL